MAGQISLSLSLVFVMCNLWFVGGNSFNTTVEIHIICPDQCSCRYNNSVIDCTSRSLTSIPPIPVSAEVLLLDNNPLGTVPSQAFVDLPDLKHLSLQNCSLTSVQPQAFRGAASLSRLVLSWNKLVSLPGDLVSINESLEYLFVNNNEMSLESVSPGLVGLSRLKVLDVSANNITSDVGLPHIFNELVNLDQLKMGYCTLTLESTFFSPLQNVSLTSLSLQGCTISNVSESAMVHFSSLKVLDLKNSRMTSSDVKSLIQGLENCTSLETLHMDKMFTEPKSLVHKHLFMPLDDLNLKNLTFTKNYMAFGGSLSNKIFKPLHTLERLDLSYCGLHTISSNALQSLRHLKSLVLVGNLLTCYTADTCGFLRRSHNTQHSGLQHLEYLDLSDNNIQTDSHYLTLKGSVFKKLKMLKLASNKITRLRQGMLINVNTLYRLELSGNPISTIEENWLQGMDYLTYLYLNASYLLTNLDGNIFHGARRLEYIYLAGSGIYHIHPEAFSGLRMLVGLYLRDNSLDNTGMTGVRLDTNNLSKLDVGHNFFTRVPDLALSQQNITVLDLDYNSITDINPLSNLTKLEILDLSFNSITRLCPNFFRQHPKLRRISFQGNPFNCGCDFQNFEKLINQSDITIVKRENHLCHDPPEVNGTSIFKFQPSYWQCKSKHVAVPFLCILVTLFMFIVFGVIRRSVCPSPHIECSRDCCNNCYFPLKQHTEISYVNEDLSRL